MTCKDCIHFDVCLSHDDDGSMADTDYLDICDEFVDKRLFAKLSGKVKKFRERLDKAEQCLMRVEESLLNGCDRKWARSIIEEYFGDI